MLLFEHGSQVEVSDRPTLERSLIEIWQQRIEVNPRFPRSADDPIPQLQPFLTFDGKKVRANNYVGFIQNGDELIEIFPKVFRHQPEAFLTKDLMLRHIFFWLSYCRKWKFPFTRTSLDDLDIESFPELIINLIAKQFLEAVSSTPLSMYQDHEAVLQSPKGTINFKRYATNSLSRGHFHQLECDFEPFLFDNKVNRIIKHCTRVLLNRTRLTENVRLLQETVFILDEVEDIVASVHDLESLSINPFFGDYLAVLDSCRIILNESLYSSKSHDLSQWCLLFPMEYLFEDFVAGFLEEHFGDRWKVEYQKSDMFLSNAPRAFQMQHDIYLTSRSNPELRIIVDTKYKLRDQNFKSDDKKGISQTDLYQMVSYAVKRGCTEVILIYPNTSEYSHDPDKFEIESGFSQGERINVTAIEIPFWSFENFSLLRPTLCERFDRCLNQ